MLREDRAKELAQSYLFVHLPAPQMSAGTAPRGTLNCWPALGLCVGALATLIQALGMTNPRATSWVLDPGSIPARPPCTESH